MSFRNKNLKISLAISIILLLALCNSAYFFISILGFNVHKWLVFNACSLSIIVYLICFALKVFTGKEFWVAISILPMYYYGTMGLFLMPWVATNVFAHITHIILTLNLIWIVYLNVKNKEYEQLGQGLLIGTAVFVPIFAYIHSYSQSNMSELINALNKL